MFRPIDAQLCSIGVEIQAGESHDLIYYHSLEFAELYDLKKDPSEFNNIWDHPDACDARDMMTVMMINRMADTVDPLPIRLGEG